MLLPLPCLCSPSSSPDDNTSFPHIAGTTSLSSSTSDDTISVITHPSLPSLQSLNPFPPFSASFLCLSTITTPSSAALTASTSSLLLYSATQSTLSIYSLTDLRTIQHLPVPPNAGAAKSISLSPDGATLFTAHQDGRIRVWNRSARSGQHRLITSLPTPADRLRNFPLPKNYVTIRRHHRRLWIQHADAVSGVAAGDSGLLYSVSWDKTMKIWSAAFGFRCLESVLAHEDAVNAVVVAKDGTVYTGSADRRIRVWVKMEGVKKHELVATLDRHRSAVNALALSGDGCVLYSGACDRSVLVWEREEKGGYMKVTGALRGHEKAILSLACDGEIVVSGCGDGVVRVWRREGIRAVYNCVAVMGGHARGVKAIVVVRMPVVDCDGGEEEYRVCSGSLDGEVRVWRVCVYSAHCEV